MIRASGFAPLFVLCLSFAVACLLNWRCRLGTCVPSGNPLIGCIAGGPNGCINCSVAILTGGEMLQVDGLWVAPDGALRGVLIPQVGMRLKDVGKTNLPIDTLVLTISEDGGEAYPVNDKWFDSHHMNLQSDRPASFYILTVLRPDCDWTEMVTIRRA